MHHDSGRNGNGSVDNHRSAIIDSILSQKTSTWTVLSDEVLWTAGISIGLGVAIWAFITLVELAVM